MEMLKKFWTSRRQLTNFRFMPFYFLTRPLKDERDVLSYLVEVADNDPTLVDRALRSLSEERKPPTIDQMILRIMQLKGEAQRKPTPTPPEHAYAR